MVKSAAGSRSMGPRVHRSMGPNGASRDSGCIFGPITECFVPQVTAPQALTKTYGPMDPWPTPWTYGPMDLWTYFSRSSARVASDFTSGPSADSRPSAWAADW
jgi:hypothetical protein